MKKRTLRRRLAEEISDDQLRQITGSALMQTDPEGVPTYNERGEEVD
jgi:hypothetical protein